MVIEVKKEEPKIITTDVRNCARCGMVHPNTKFLGFDNPVASPDGEIIWTHWALCPLNKQPILLRVIEETR